MVSKLFVDGSNLFRGIADVLPPGSFIEFSDLLKEIRKDFQIDWVYFYASYMSQAKATSPAETLRVRAQIEFLNRVRTIPKLTFYKGYYSGRGKEKGVDVHLAVDLVQQGMRNEFFQAVLMTGDDDLMYPVQVLNQLAKPVHLAAFCTRFPFGISFHVDQCFLYDYQEHFSSTVLPGFKRPPRKLRVRQLPAELPIYEV